MHASITPAKGNNHFVRLSIQWWPKYSRIAMDAVSGMSSAVRLRLVFIMLSCVCSHLVRPWGKSSAHVKPRYVILELFAFRFLLGSQPGQFSAQSFQLRFLLVQLLDVTAIEL